MTVYFARAVGTDRIKIGYVQASGADAIDAVARRIKQLSWMFGVPIALVVTTEGKRRLERWYHHRHAATALGRYEWFNLSPALAADIESLQAKGVIDGQPPPASLHHKKYRAWSEVTTPSGERFWNPEWGFSQNMWRTHIRRLRETAAA